MATDITAHLYYENHRKSKFVIFLLWCFLGLIEAHRFYVGKSASAGIKVVVRVVSVVALLALNSSGDTQQPLYFGAAIALIIVNVMTLIDVFLIFGWVMRYNDEVLARAS